MRSNALHRTALRHAIVATALLMVLALRPAQAVDVDSPPGGAVPGSSAPGDAPVRTIFLTFDDGPYQPWTQEMLDVLAEYKAHATFFIIGRQAAAEPDTIQKIYDGGNGLGNHGYNHANLTGVSQQYFDAEVGDTGALFGDMNSMCLRPPYGAIDYNVVDYADQLGYSVVKWNLDPEDWRNPGADAIARHVIDNARDGSIVVMHDGGGDRSQTVEAVRTILKTLIVQGFQFKALCRDYPMADLTNALLETPTPDPNVTATPTPTATPSPTETPWPTATPTPTPTPTPALTATLTATLTAANTPGPTLTRGATLTAAPTTTVGGTTDAASTATPADASSELPTTTPKASPTTRPAATPATAATAATLRAATRTPARTPSATAAAPTAEATEAPTPEPIYGTIIFPSPGSTVAGALLVQGNAHHPNFEKWQLDLLVDGTEPVFLAMGEEPVPNVGRLAVWNTRAFPNGSHMLRLRVVNTGGNYVEYFTHVTVAN